MPAPEPAAAAPRPGDRLELAIGGMTCAACARRVEKALRRAPGVADAVVNLATERATVVVDPAIATPAALGAIVADAGYRASPVDEAAAAPDPAGALGRRVAVAAALTAPVVVLGMSHGALRVPGDLWIQLALTAVVMAWAGAPIFRAAAGAVRHGGADMNVLVALGTSAAFGWSAVATATGRGHVYFEAAAVIVTLVLLGRWLEARARRRAGEALGRLRRLVPPVARVRAGGGEERRLVEHLRVGDLVVVRPGETIPADGEVVEGASSVAEAVLTGEAMPVDRRPGDPVLAGTSNGWGRLVVRVGREPGATALAAIVAAVEAALGSRAPIARVADRVAGIFTPIVLAVAIATLAGWVAAGAPVEQALVDAVAVLVVACPCALGLATPTALVVGLGRGAELGVLVKDAAALERLGSVDVVVVDKTGTITEGQPFLVAAELAPGARAAEPELLALVAGAEEGSEHPIAGAFLRAAGARGIAVPAADAFEAAPGRGIAARVGGREVVAGSPAFVRERLGAAAADAGGWLGAAAAALAARGLTPVAAAVDGRIAAAYGVGDHPRPGAAEAVAALARRGIEVVMLTGDAAGVADRVAAEVGIRRVIAGALPADKARHVAALRAGGRRVAMVGDGVNDAPALAAADVGIAMGSATDVAAASAEVVLLRDELPALAAAVVLARRTLSTIRQNLGWAFGYNVVALPVAAGLLAPWTGWRLSPMLAAAAMMLSSLSVLLNSLRLRGWRPRPAAPVGR